MYSYKEFEKLLKEDFFSFDLMGHDTGKRKISNILIDRIKRDILKKIDFLNKSKPFKKILSGVSHPIKVGEPFDFLGVTFDCNQLCGEYYHLGLIDEKTISIFRIHGGIGTGQELKFFHDEKCKCKYSNGVKPLIADFTFDSELVVLNSFRNKEGNYLFSDSPEDKKYTPEWSLCNMRGIENITKYKQETHNVAYGQMGNMGIGVYINKDRDHVIIADGYLDEYSDLSDYTQEDIDAFENWEIQKSNSSKWLKENNFEMLGDISLSVWRWEATDRSTLNKLEYDQKKQVRDYDDVVVAKIQPGEWRMSHYYSSCGPKIIPDGIEIYSEFKLKK